MMGGRKPTGGVEDNESSVRLLNAKSLKCSFPDGVFTEWNTGQFKTEAAGKMKDIIFDSINSKKQRARMLGSQGSTDVAALSSLGALHFMDISMFKQGLGNIASAINRINCSR